MTTMSARARAVSFAILAGLSALPLASSAADNSDGASACKQARLAAWFEHQRELTDGNVSPFMDERALSCEKLASNGDAVAKAQPNDAKPVVVVQKSQE